MASGLEEAYADLERANIEIDGLHGETEELRCTELESTLFMHSVWLIPFQVKSE